MLHYLDFILVILLSAAAFLCVTAYRNTGRRAFCVAAAYFLVLLAIEFIHHDRELNGVLYRFLLSSYKAAVLPTALCYTAAAALLAELAATLYHAEGHTLTLICLIFFPIWFLNVSLHNGAYLVNTWLFITPYQIYTLALSLFYLWRMKRGGTQAARGTRALLLLTAVFSVLIAAEDSLVTWYPELLPIKALSSTPRNFAENILQIIYAIAAICLCMAALSATPHEARSQESNAIDHAAFIDAYAAQIGLSARERDVLRLLQEGKNNQDICQELSLSIGTVKAHTHNIFQKADCTSRAELTESFAAFVRARQ